jgi:SAM-dependent methyltransferase
MSDGGVRFRAAGAVVVSWDVLEHIEPLDDALKTIYDRLADNGILIGVVPVYDGPLGWLVHRMDRDPTHLHSHLESRRRRCSDAQ